MKRIFFYNISVVVVFILFLILPMSYAAEEKPSVPTSELAQIVHDGKIYGVRYVLLEKRRYKIIGTDEKGDTLKDKDNPIEFPIPQLNIDAFEIAISKVLPPPDEKKAWSEDSDAWKNVSVKLLSKIKSQLEQQRIAAEEKEKKADIKKATEETRKRLQKEFMKEEPLIGYLELRNKTGEMPLLVHRSHENLDLQKGILRVFGDEVWFEMDSKLKAALESTDSGVPELIRERFEKNKITLSDDAKTEKVGDWWLITDGENQYGIREVGGRVGGLIRSIPVAGGVLHSISPVPRGKLHVYKRINEWQVEPSPTDSSFLRIKKLSENSLDLKSVEVLFEDGAITDILLKGTLKHERTYVEITNLYPIPVRTSGDIGRINQPGKNTLKYGTDKVGYHIDLSDVIVYSRKVVVGNYIPKNGRVTLIVKEKNRHKMELRKLSIIDNLDVRLYTDVTGFQEAQPNGLIQTEAKYDMVLQAKRLPLFKVGILNPLRHKLLPFNKLSPFITISKIENKVDTLPLDSFFTDDDSDRSYSISKDFIEDLDNKRITEGLRRAFRDEGNQHLSQTSAILVEKKEEVTVEPQNASDTTVVEEKRGRWLITDEDKKQRFSVREEEKDLTVFKESSQTTTLDLIRFANLNLGLDLNLLSFMTSTKKARLNLVGGIYRTNVESSSLSVLEGEQTVSNSLKRDVFTWYLMPTLLLGLIDRDALDFDVSLGFMRLNLRDEDISVTNREWVTKSQMNLNIHPNSENQDQSVFFRTTFLYNDKSNHDLSLQIGYSTPLSGVFSSGAKPSESENQQEISSTSESDETPSESETTPQGQ